LQRQTDCPADAAARAGDQSNFADGIHIRSGQNSMTAFPVEIQQGSGY
jgi:hypothetical protein